MTDLTEYGKGYSPSAGLTYEPGGELAKELEHKIAKLKGLLKSALSWLPDSSKLRGLRYAQLQDLKRKIIEVLK